MSTPAEPEPRREFFAARYFLDDPDALDGAQLTIGSPAARRLNRVMRVRRDDIIQIVHPPSERLYTVRVTRVTREAVEGHIEDSRAVRPPAAPPITLCPALLRPQRFDFMVEKATELGVAAIQPIWTERSQIRAEGLQRLARWRRLATEASEQSGREVRPEVHPPLDFAAFAAAPAPPGALRIFASALEPETRVAALFEQSELPAEVQILVGPAGGLSPSEASLARTNGWRAVTLGPRPLRAETASIVAVALTAEAIAACRAPTRERE